MKQHSPQCQYSSPSLPTSPGLRRLYRSCKVASGLKTIEASIPTSVQAAVYFDRTVFALRHAYMVGHIHTHTYIHSLDRTACEPEGWMLFHLGSVTWLGNVTYLLDVIPSNPLPHRLSSLPIPLPLIWFLSNIQQTSNKHTYIPTIIHTYTHTYIHTYRHRIIHTYILLLAPTCVYTTTMT